MGCSQSSADLRTRRRAGLRPSLGCLIHSKKKNLDAREGGRVARGSLGDGGVVGSVFWIVWATGTAGLLGIWAEDLLIVAHSPAIWATSHLRYTS